MDTAVSVGKAALHVIQTLIELRSVQINNRTIVQEIDEFITSLNNNIAILNLEHLPNKSKPWAYENLQIHLDKTREELVENLKNGNFKKFWDAKKIMDKLEGVRKDLLEKIQVTHFVTTLEVAINASEKTDNFQSKMMELFAMSSAHNQAATAERAAETRKLLQPLLVGITRNDQRLASFISQVTGDEVKVERSSETQKFLADVLAKLEYLTDEEISARRATGEDERDDYLDPFTKELMIDPVKCTDGHTYDRFSVFKYNLYQREPLVIACDDLNVRQRLYEKFAEEDVETKCRNLRESYRDEALKLAYRGYSAEALRMLKNVLQWAATDRECLEMKAKLEQEITTQPPVAAMQMHQPYAPQVGYPVAHQPTKVGNFGEYHPENRPPQGNYDQQNQGNVRDRAWTLLSEELDGCEICGIIFLFMCFPCSLCCVPCCFPNAMSRIRGLMKPR